MASHYQKARFLLSVAKVEQLPPDRGIEVAMVGRSNAGKSSALNRLVNIKGLARVSKTPGRTQLVNIFELDPERRLVDLPGYGYAKVPLAAKLAWQKTVDEYVTGRECLKGLVLIMDIRHPMQELDKQLLEYCDERDLNVHILLNKSDKLSRGAALSTMHTVSSSLTGYRNSVTFQCFSALRGTGLKEFQAVLDGWYEFQSNSTK